MSQNIKEFVIVGAGPIGLLLAIAIARLGHNVSILESKTKAEHISRADTNKISRLYAIAAGSYEIISNDVGVKLNTSRFQPINEIFINDGSAITNFNPRQIDAPNFGFMIEESDLFGQLLNEIAKFKNIKIHYNVNDLSVKEEGEGAASSVFLTAGKLDFRADLILAADGRNSSIRRDLPFEMKCHNYNESAMVFTISHPEFAHKGLAVETFLPSGPFAVLPHRDPHQSSVVWSLKRKSCEAFIGLNKPEQHEIIAEKLLEKYGSFEIVSKIISYPLQLMLPYELFHKNILLIGDSSHVVHPIAGQGFNLGIRDVKALLNYFKEIDLYHNINHMLITYQAERLQDINKLANSTDILSDLFSNNNLPLKILRKTGLTIFDILDKTKVKVMRYAAGNDHD